MLTLHAPQEPLTAHQHKLTRASQAGPGMFYSVPDEKRLSLDTTKNIVIHFFVPRALFALSLLAPGPSPLQRSEIEERFLGLCRLFAFEFRVPAREEARALFAETQKEFEELGLLEESPARELRLGRGPDGVLAEHWCRMLAAILGNYLEGYRLAARALFFLEEQPLAEEEMLRRALLLGNRMFFAGELSRREAVTRPILENAWQSFAERRLISIKSDRLELTEAGRAEGALGALEAEIAAWLKGPSS